MVETIPTANHRAMCWWFLKLPWREKRKVPSERAMNIESETGVKSDTPFCLRLPIEKTNSAMGMGMSPEPTQGSGAKFYAYHVDQHEKLKGLDV